MINHTNDKLELVCPGCKTNITYRAEAGLYWEAYQKAREDIKREIRQQAFKIGCCCCLLGILVIVAVIFR
jgi:hypothetical protein